MKEAHTKKVDDPNYTVVGINGFKQTDLTKKQAIKLARQMQTEINTAGLQGKMQIFSHDGSLVEWAEVPEEIVTVCEVRTTNNLPCRRCIFWLSEQRCKHEKILKNLREKWLKNIQG